MNLRVALRNWLLKPSAAEGREDSAAVEAVGAPLYGAIQRDLERELASGGNPVRAFPSVRSGDDRHVIVFIGNPLLTDEQVAR